MQWSTHRNGGFSTAPAERLLRPVITGGDFGYERVNVTAQRRDPESLLSWFERMIRTLRECPEVGTGRCSLPEVDVPDAVLVHRFDAPEGAMLFLHNLGAEGCTLHIGHQPGAGDEVVEVFADRGYDAPSADLRDVPLGPWGYRWIRLRQDVSAG
jgi:maltose alpha-D-glucosyltransferase/alpha-amylase